MSIIILKYNLILEYNQTKYFTSGSKQSTPSTVLPETPSCKIILHLGSYFFVTETIASLTFIDSLALLSLPNDVKIVDVP